MHTLIRHAAGKFLLNVLAGTWTAALPLALAAQPPPEEHEQLVEYAQCIRANGYADFPDPGPGGLQFRLEAGAVQRFEAAQRACKDKLPSGHLALDAAPTPEVLDAMVQFARCVRASGVPEFPDPAPQGSFEIARGLDMSTPRAQQALQTCRETHPVGALRLRLGG